MSAITGIIGAREGTVREYRTTDKSEWRDGQWQDEPDKVQWIDNATDMDCLIVRGPSGALCGYVGVLPTHPWHGKDYSACTQTPQCEESWCDHTVGSRTSVHGGLTFADSCQHTDDESRGVCHVPLNGRSDSVWWFGFDCAHYGDVTPKHDDGRYDGWYKTIGYVNGEVCDLARQLKAVPS